MDSIDTTADVPEVPDQGKKLGLSKLVYGLGMAARDSLVTFVTATAALLPVMYYGQGKYSVIDKLAKVPDKLQGLWKKSFGEERSGRAGKALAVSAGLATIVSYAAHLPGLFRGPRKIREAEATYAAEVQDNKHLASEIKDLTETVKRQSVELTEAKMQSPAFAEKVRDTATAASPSPAEPQACFTGKMETDPSMTTVDKVLTRRAAANESQFKQTA